MRETAAARRAKARNRKSKPAVSGEVPAKPKRTTYSRRPKIDEPGISLITRLMRHYRYTQRELAAACGTTKTTIRSIQHGHLLPRVDVAIRMARIFRVTVEQLWSDGRLQ